MPVLRSDCNGYKGERRAQRISRGSEQPGHEVLWNAAKRGSLLKEAHSSDYPIFIGISERVGKNNSGDYVFMPGREDGVGNPLIDLGVLSRR